MEPSKKHFQASSSFFLMILLSFFNLQGLNLLRLATASPVVRGNDTDRQALLQFKAKITGDPLKIMESWNSSIHFCQWFGVTCGRKHRRVTKLKLRILKLSGSLSPYIGNLSFLRELDLVGNSFYNQIPQEIGGLRRLEALHLVNNSISGEIPSNLSVCSKLTSVDMMEKPASLGLLSNLKVLGFVYNSLRGSIPPSLGNLSSLEKLGLTYNALIFAIFRNAISGIVPIALFNLSNIRAFDIGTNKIQGTLHSDLEINMPHVEFFSVGQNQISGQISISISNASNLNVLDFHDNMLDGNVPLLEKLDNLFDLELGINHFEHGRKCDLNFICTLVLSVNKTKLEYLSIVKNNGGEFPECISNFSSNLRGLAMGENNILEKIPDGIGNLINLEVLVFSINQLSGPIPFNIGRLQKLKGFFANSNFVSGTIAHSIGNLSELIELDLNFNHLQGSIPSGLGNCKNLLLMDLSSNNELSVVVENFKTLGILDVSQNRLSGLLLKNLGSCVSLHKLFLEGNLFEGPIPLSLSSLKGLEALDLSDNNLSGGIPKFLVRFRALKYLNLSFNDFEGLIPSERVFKNASATFLCGGIPELHLSRCNSKKSPKTSLKLKITIMAVISGVTLVFSIFLIIWFRMKKEQKPTTTTHLSYQSILRTTNGFSPQNLVGSGSFGSVYKGILEANEAVIAVKEFNLLNHRASRSFLVECEALKNIRHRNLVKILTAISGIDYKGNDFKALVYEFMQNGSLEDWLHPSVGMNKPETIRNLNFIQRLNVAIDVAHALKYLHHCCETPIIHYDLKPSNVLLDGEMVGHKSDFGLAKILSGDKPNYSTNESSSLGLTGTIGYTSPGFPLQSFIHVFCDELIVEYGMGSELSTNGDVYSYGILLLEMLTGKKPTNERFKEGLSLHNFVKATLPDQVVEIIDPILLQESVRGGTSANITLYENDLGNDIHLQCFNSIFEIRLTCSTESPSERMDMSNVITKLCSIREKLLRPTRLRRGI
ncbi:hypothetical protein GOBAR_AA36264 [Gossypium barbadense]|uniref:non-specific serine/threonine protein kinase n=1 Tax=Gossypium barbadense TaxID=3634 RepID=A0A2P5W048_GOSBA|nr:hypothetical protein GOBAR_AA36264 [Gossypium barbadense]